MLVENVPAACYVKGGTTVHLDCCQIEFDENMSGLYVENNYDATVTASGNVFVVVDPQGAMVEEVSAEGGSRMLWRRDDFTLLVTECGVDNHGEKDSTCQKDAVFLDQEHIIELPAAISPGGHNTKVSRKLGIMIVRLPKVV